MVVMAAGQTYNISDFFCEFDGSLRDGDEYARLIMKTGGEDGYFNNDKFVRQVARALDIAERKFCSIHPNIRLVFKFDNAPLHHKRAPDALVAKSMNKNPGDDVVVQSQLCSAPNERGSSAHAARVLVSQ